MSTSTTTYDTVPYSGHALAQAHPDRLATIARLFGMKTADLARSRVLELGCGDGLNLTSVALSLPEAECLGIDLAAAGIQKGQECARSLGLKNIEFRQLDILDIGESLGRFDYIIAHGIYSWVPEAVRDKLLAICKQNLTSNGVAYVSYNTYPGGHLRDLVREMMLFHVSDFKDAKQRVTQARSLIKFIIDAGGQPDVYRLILQKELERINEFTDSSLFHDDLSEHNAPVYFYQFVEHAARHGLKYLSEAHFFEIQTGIFPAQVVDVLNRISDSAIAKEQYLDFLKCRRFRQTLLCHDDQKLDDEPRPEKVASFNIASPVRSSEAEQKVQSRELTTFIGPKNSSVQTDNPLIKAAMSALGQAWPKALHFSDLLAVARQSCKLESLAGTSNFDDDARILGELLLRAYAGGMIEFSLAPPRFVARPSERPVASPLARLQSKESSEVVNLRHFNIRVDPLAQQILSLLDGSRDRSALLNDLASLVESGVAVVETDNGATADNPEELRRCLAAAIDRKLAELAEMALLVA
jgi:methyltransferase-like protein/2-polyprenyl-3-methyl-5-hydroxy-6-metoxy-1,4-benzoquinol methylase